MEYSDNTLLYAYELSSKILEQSTYSHETSMTEFHKAAIALELRDRL